MTDKPRFHVIQGTPAPDTPVERVRKRVRAMPKPAAMIQCHRCGGREVIETNTGVMLKGGKHSGGTKALICVACLIKGQRVTL
ncbi:hypothetical protein AUC61_14555 [Pseudomonas sp. S25]|uniref:Uncharacterized protein n=1 Tax=Pseudomonas maioricensis TaxID=1766623 RepID=A0ABS9ZKB2_9PSED|nr:hypothetical protein [Pseudomonas sp. S25]